MPGPWEKYQKTSDAPADGPWAKYAQSPAAKPEKPSSKVEAAIEGFGESASLGYLNNLQAAAEKPIFAALNAITGNDVQADDYVKARDFYNRRQEALKAENPGSFTAGQVAGTIASSVPVAKAAQGATVAARAMNAAKAGAAMGLLRNTSEKEGEFGNLNIPERIENATLEAGTSALGSLGADVIKAGATSAKNAITSGKNKVGEFLKKGAENLAENATGATGRQAEKFSPGTGRYLLDEGIVQAGDSAENVAAKTAKAITKSEQGIDSALKTLDERGVTVPQDQVIGKIQSQISELRKDPSQADIVRKLEGIVEDIKATGQTEVNLSSGEQFKRGFNRMAKNWQDPEKGQAGKVAYRAYRDAVEEAADVADAELGQQFKESKQAFGKLQPVLDASEKRAAQLNQSPFGGLGDIASEAVAPGGSIVRRLVSPRLSSTAAVAADRISKRLISDPEIAAVAQKNPEAFKAMIFGFMKDHADGSVPGVPAAAENKNDAPLKGPTRWVNDGLKNLRSHDSSIFADPAVVEQLKSSKKGKELLIRASELSPNSPAMAKVAAQIKSQLEAN